MAHPTRRVRSGKRPIPREGRPLRGPDDLVFGEGLCHCGCGETAPLRTQNSERGRKGDPCRFVYGHGTRPEYVVDDDSGCWVWQGNRSGSGYGLTSFHAEFRGYEAGAHRVYYRTFVGDIPDGLWVLHRCDNPPCVNPEHLFVGTAADNVRDMMAKGRHHTMLAGDDQLALNEEEHLR